MSFVSQMISLFFGLILLTILARLWFTRSSEDYAFLTVDEETGDLAIVGGGDLTVDESGALKSTGNFNVGGGLTTNGDITATGKKITAGSLESTGNMQSVSITTGGITASGDIDATGKKITSGSLTTGDITSNGYINTTQTVKSDGLDAKTYLKIGNTTIYEDDLKRLKGLLPIKLKNTTTGSYVLRRKDGHDEVGVWDTGYKDLEDWKISPV